MPRNAPLFINDFWLSQDNFIVSDLYVFVLNM